jgi:hypothetical protein
VERQLISFLGTHLSIQRLGEPKRFQAYKYVLFHPDSLPWSHGLRDQIYSMFRGAKHDAIAFENVCDLLELLSEAVEYRRGDIDLDGVRVLLQNAKFVRSLWRAALTRNIQWRMQVNFLQHRSRLMKAGVPESALPLTAALKKRLPEMPA